MYEVTRINIYFLSIKKKLTFSMNVLKVSWIVELFGTFSGVCKHGRV